MKIHGLQYGISCTELHHLESDSHFLVDCGMVQGISEWNQNPFPFDPKSIGFVFLTSAQLDHSGLIPKLIRKGFSGPVYCTLETAELAKIVLYNATKTGFFDKGDVNAIQWKEPKGDLLTKVYPLNSELAYLFYRSSHILGSISLEIRWGKNLDKLILFSGDLDGSPDGEERHLLRSRQVPFENVKPGHFFHKKHRYMLLNGTYGDRRFQKRSFAERIQNLKKTLEESLLSRPSEDPTLLITSFSMHQTQNLLFDLTYLFAREAKFRKIPIYFDDPMGLKINKIYARHMGRISVFRKGKKNTKIRPTWINHQYFEHFGLNKERDFSCLSAMIRIALGQRASLQNFCGQAYASNALIRAWKKIWKEVKDRKAWLNSPSIYGPKILVTSEGMCQEGTCMHYLPHLLGQKSTTVLFIGQVLPESLGEELLGFQNLKIPNQSPDFNVNFAYTRLKLKGIQATIRHLHGYCSDADQQERIRWVFPPHYREKNTYYSTADTLWIIRGNFREREALAQALKSEAQRLGKSLDILIPRDEWYELDDFDRLSLSQQSRVRTKVYVS